MTQRAVDAGIDWVDGQPYSREYGDVYFSRGSGLDETRHVFLQGNRLEDRFRTLSSGASFTIGETGFGTGLNFLCAWELFARTAPAGARLHFVSTELHPLSNADLARGLALWPALASQARMFLDACEALPPATHRFLFEDGRVTLTLLVGDARQTLPELDARVDAWFLDGFAPARNPQLWCDAVLSQISRLSNPGATAATYTVAGAVRRALQAAGFSVEKTPGFGTKREMLRARSERPMHSPASAPWHRRPPASGGGHRAVVIGGGLAGTSAAASLARRGMDVTLLERSAALASGASGNAQGILYIKPSPHATALTGLSLSGLGLSLRWLRALLPQDGLAWSRCGVLTLAHDDDEAGRQRALAELGWPAAFGTLFDRVEASERAGLPLPWGGFFYPSSGWAHPPALCRAFASHSRISVRTGCQVRDLVRNEDGTWIVAFDDGGSLAGDVVVVANGLDAACLARTAWFPLKPIRGQIASVPATAASAALRTVLCGESYAAPARDGFHCIGATFGVGEASTQVRAGETAENLAMLRSLAPALHDALGAASLDPAAVAARAGVRCVTPDYLPISGPVVDEARFRTAFAALRSDAKYRFDGDAPWLSGLYATTGHGSRGLVTAPVCAELVASLVAGEPLPLPRSVVQALAPARFLVRSMARHRADPGEARVDPQPSGPG